MRGGRLEGTGFGDRGEIEDALDEALRSARLGNTWGGGTGLLYSYVDLVLSEVVLDTALHDLAAAFQESHDTRDGIEVLVDGENVAALSGMLHGEVPGEGEWIDRFSSFGPLGQPRETVEE